jgi:hypothetical protein
MKPLIIALLLTTLAGCSSTPRMSNDAIIAEAMKCEQVGLPWRQVFNAYDGSVVDVYCTPHLPDRSSK